MKVVDRAVRTIGNWDPNCFQLYEMERNLYRARICKRLRSPGIDSKKSIPLAYVTRLGIDFWAPLNVYKYGLSALTGWGGGGWGGVEQIFLKITAALSLIYTQISDGSISLDSSSK